MHTVQIPDATWERLVSLARGEEMTAGAYVRMVLRDVESRGATNGTAPDPEPETEPEPPRVAAGTAFTAGRQSWCPRCGGEINPGDRAVMMDWITPTGRTKGDAFDIKCARERGWAQP